MHIQEPAEKAWIQRQVEGASVVVDPDEQRHILSRLNAAEALERFLATKYLGQKRFGIDGAESAIPILDAVISAAADTHLDSVVMGMAHRGRLNVLVNIVGKSYEQLFTEFEGNVDPESTQGSGDVKYHLGQTGKFVSRNGNTIEVELAANPSHLETVDPVVEGMARAKMDLIDPPGEYPVLPILIHGDAAFAGQGVVAETLNLSLIKGYRVGGTIHLIINNQLGFTTPPDSARSSEYPTDVAKMVQAPIFHVNGDDPEACVRVAQTGVRLPPGVQQGRRHRHGVLPPPRPQRGRRPQLHPAADVQAHRRPPLGAQALHRGAGQAGRHLPGRRRGRPRRLQQPPAERAGGDPPARTRRRAPGPSPRRPPWACSPTSPPASAGPRSTPSSRALETVPDGLRGPSQAGPAVRDPTQDVRVRRGRLGARRGHGLRLAALRGHLGAPGRPGHAPGHLLASPRRAGRLRDGSGAHAAGPPGDGRAPSSGSTTRCCRSTRPWASSTATRWSTRTPWSSGRPSSATSSTAPRSSSTSTWWRPRTSGARPRGWCCCCPTATRARGPSTRRGASNGS